MPLIKYSALCAAILLFHLSAFSQKSGNIKGKVLDITSNRPLSAAQVTFKKDFSYALTNSKGKFQLDSLKPGNYTLITNYVGYYTDTVPARVKSEQTTELTIKLHPKLKELEEVKIKEKSVKKASPGQAFLSNEEITSTSSTDPGEAATSLPGVSGVRRGPVGIDPVIRGLRGQQLGQYINGSRSFSGGPARMDSPLSHTSPAMTDKLRVVKGPSALSKGPGNLSTIELQTLSFTTLPDSTAGGSVHQSWQNNGEQLQTAAKIGNRATDVPFIIGANWQQGNDYRAGNDNTIPADFLSRGAEGRLQVPLHPQGWLNLRGGYQQQNNIDYPGRILNARFFKVGHAQAEYLCKPKDTSIREIKGQVSYRNINHQMTNNGKPTAQRDTTRMPPFPLDISIKAFTNTIDARFHISWNQASNLQMKAGLNGYYIHKNAVRRIRNRDNEALLNKDFLWPQAGASNGGVFFQTDYQISSKASISGTARLDGASVQADSVSKFFKENVSETNSRDYIIPSASARLQYSLSDHWQALLGLGSTARSPAILELFSNRVPSSRAQTSAEFAGNPSLQPERNNQADLDIQGDYKKLSIRINPFFRYMNNYITIRETELTKKLPLSPETVFQYTNADALFGGGELTLAWTPVKSLTLSGTTHYLRGQNLGTNQPVLGTAPLKARGTIHYRYQSWYAKISPEWVRRQNRTARILGETQTPGFTLWNASLGYRLSEKIRITLKGNNLTDKFYIKHLTAKNPFTGQQIPERGRNIRISSFIRF